MNKYNLATSARYYQSNNVCWAIWKHIEVQIKSCTITN
nr:MAG TPA: hypothetical protein [Caudoviricetes sp.]